MEKDTPKLQAICAKQIATRIRNVTIQERYNYFKKIPHNIAHLIKAFPTNYIIFVVEEFISVMVLDRIFETIKYDRDIIDEVFHEMCEYGNNKSEYIIRKCTNLYCDDDVIGPIIDHSYYPFNKLCNQCKIYRPSPGKFALLKRDIKKSLKKIED